VGIKGLAVRSSSPASTKSTLKAEAKEGKQPGRKDWILVFLKSFKVESNREYYFSKLNIFD
jgi:hypothetical protein